MQRRELLRVVRALLDQPTAPFHEDAVRAAIVVELGQCRHVRIEHDTYGNMIARYRRGTRSRPRWAFAAHMDHPGWVRIKDGSWRFLGSVAERFLANPRKREFGNFAMWDLPAFELKDGLIHSRACDDLLGCAEIICLFRELESRARGCSLPRHFHPRRRSRFLGSDSTGAFGNTPESDQCILAGNEHAPGRSGNRPWAHRPCGRPFIDF